MATLPKGSLSKTQTVCIDLPGESIQCWRTTDKVQVVLKKHRDIIFDLRLAENRSYTVESTGSDFYNANSKKLIAGAGRQRVLFKDGERLHLWIARDFRGELLLKSAGKLMMKLEPSKLDAHQYPSDPRTKPVPIVVAIGVPSQASPLQPYKIQRASTSYPNVLPVQPASAPLDEECAIVCVVDGDIKGIPADIWRKLKNGGGNSGLIDLDPNDIATQNWLLVQLANAAAYVGNNWNWLRSSIDGNARSGFKLVKAEIHYVRGKARYYFSGYSNSNKVFGPGGFGAGHDRILQIFSGAGKINSAAKSAVSGVAGSLRGIGLVAFIFGNAASFAEWKNDLSKDGYDLSATLLMNLIKTIVVAALTAAIVAIIIAVVMFMLGLSVSTVAVGALTLTVGIGIAYVVDAADKKIGCMVGGDDHNDGLSGIMAKQMRKNVEENWTFLREKKFWDYKEEWLERSRFN
ncbi:hypothetical protein [Massilia sp. BSC265]|uniref:hypothetical protein n=1 Tax=Massilia sp. BSC265 TaxID=1549812 RepID=UPI000B18CC41|nr:hypothetical protein [Massilia sp. BSC265]